MAKNFTKNKPTRHQYNSGVLHMKNGLYLEYYSSQSENTTCARSTFHPICSTRAVGTMADSDVTFDTAVATLQSMFQDIDNEIITALLVANSCVSLWGYCRLPKYALVLTHTSALALPLPRWTHGRHSDTVARNR